MPPRVHGQNHGGVGMSVRVIVRKRPTQEDENDILEVHPPVVTVYVQKVKVDLTKYQFAQSFRVDDSFSEADSTRELYDRSVSELVRNVYEAGGTSTAFCFGQTASGKTYTLFGAGGGLAAHETSLSHSGEEAKAEQGGLYLLAAYEIYQRAQAESDPDIHVSISLSMYEIKGQRMYDLLNDHSELQALEDSDGVLQLVGLSQHPCESIHDFIDVSNAGRSARSTTATGANATSSRSHCAMLVRIYRNGNLLGKLSLIDLAGSERGADNEDTDATTRREGRDINTSLLALKEVIRALQSGKHAPFRQSRLTQVLEESLTGPNCRTVVVACVSGAEHDTQNTVNTLRYAQELRPKDKGLGMALKGAKIKRDKVLRPGLSKGDLDSRSASKPRPPLLSQHSSIKRNTVLHPGLSKDDLDTRSASRSRPPLLTQHSSSPRKASTRLESIRRSGSAVLGKGKALASTRPSFNKGNGQNHGGVSMNVRVIVRKRPLPEGQVDVIAVDGCNVIVSERKVKVDLTNYVHEQSFSYNNSFGENDSTQLLYDRCMKDLMTNVYAGGTSSTFCFGQTASGKTYTLFGAEGGQTRVDRDEDAAEGGVYLLAAYEIFQRVQAESKKDLGSNFVVALSMYEIKGQKVYDLLNEREEVKALEDGNGILQLVGLSQHGCVDLEAFLELGNIGRGVRSTAATGANETSSRSHCAMLVRVYKNDKVLGKLSLIDLAGSERGADNEDTDATTRREGRDINTSLLALKEVIRALQSGKHAPFRQSRLTQVLEESLTGKLCQTVVIACVSGAERDTQHTVNTLRYAQDLRPGAEKAKKSARLSTIKPVDVKRLTQVKHVGADSGKLDTNSTSTQPIPVASPGKARRRWSLGGRKTLNSSPSKVKQPASPRKSTSRMNLNRSAATVKSHGRNHGGVGMAVSVIVRKRPVMVDVADVVVVKAPVVRVFEQKVKVNLTKYVNEQTFTYDDAFGEDDDTSVVYDRSIKGLISNIYQGGTSMAFCFGQTASGKTFTLFGAGGGQTMYQATSAAGLTQAEAEQGGLYVMAASEIFERAEDLSKEIDNTINVSLSMYEIKGQRLFDLLNDRSELQALEDSDGVLQLVGLSQHPCVDLEDFLDLSHAGRSARSTAVTGANATSSRSHCAMLVRIYKNGDLLGKLSLIDLAGSERGADNEDTDATTRREGRDINTSLLALKEVIRALQCGKHAPFRQSRLTQVLEESLTGPNCRTVVVACVSGAQHDTQHTVNTLRYAQDLRPGSNKLVKSPRKTMTAPAEKSGPSTRPSVAQKAPKKRNSFLMGANVFSPRLGSSRKKPLPKETLGLGSLSPSISRSSRASSDDLDLTVEGSAHSNQTGGGGAKRSGAQRVLSGLAVMTPRNVMRRSSHRILSGNHSPVSERPSSQAKDQWLSPNSLLTAELNMDSPPQSSGSYHRDGQTGLGGKNGRFSLLEPPTPPPSLPLKATGAGRSPAHLPLPSPPREEDRNRTSVPTSPLKAKSSGRARTFRMPSYSTGRASSKATSQPLEARNNPINRGPDTNESPLVPHVGFRLPGDSSRNGRTSRDDDFLLSRTMSNSSRANRGSQSADRSTSAPALSPRATPNQRTTHGQDGVPNVSVPQRSVADLAVSFQSSDGMSISTGDLDREVLECMKIQAQSRRLSAMYQKLLGAVEVESPQLGTFL